MMKLGLATPDHLVDLPGIADLKGIRAAGSVVVYSRIIDDADPPSAEGVMTDFATHSQPWRIRSFACADG